jgi:thiamine-phosphate pyrophosphorylase
LLLYYITDRTQFGDSESARRRGVLNQIRLAAEAGVDYIQLREKDLRVRELESLAREAAELVHAIPPPRPKFIVNSRIDIAIVAGADGVHLRSDDLPASDARAIFSKAGMADVCVAASCHTITEIAAAEAHGADFAVFGPVFGKGTQAGIGIEQLRAACNRPRAAAARMPVVALGGVSLENASECITAGAAGIAAIRLFQTADVHEVVRQLRAKH